MMGKQQVNLPYLEVSQIVEMVRLEGFCVVHLNTLAARTNSKLALERAARQIARAGQLKVLFNHANGICIFESIYR